MAMARSVENACRSRRLAGTTSMPAGQRSRTAASAAVLLELEARDEAEDVVGLLLLIEPVRVGVVIYGLLLSVIEVARVRLLEVFVPGRRGQQVVLLAALARRHVEELLLRGKIGELLAQHVALGVTLYVGLGEAGREPSLHDVVLGGTAALFDLDDVVAEVGLHRVGDLPDRECPRRILERLHELTLAHPAEIAA